MRVVIVGAGVAAAVLGWRLRERGAEVVLVGAGGPRDDATAASGGLVRGFEPDPAAAELAAASLAELRGDPALAEACGYTRTGSVYVLPDHQRPAHDPGPGAELVDAARAGRLTGLKLPADAIGVHEPDGGHLAPDLLRRHALRRLPGVVDTPAARVDGRVVVLRDGWRVGGDAVVVAAGAWTPGLLRVSGLPADGLRTKHIQYAHYRVDGPATAAFVDATSGLYGRPTGPGAMLLGLPSDRWDVPPGSPLVDHGLEAAVARVAAGRGLAARPAPAPPAVSAVDCYTDPPGLALRPVAGVVWSYTGGSGGAAKTALAAGRRAAQALLDPVPTSSSGGIA
jgi:glycine/D-amino acid oxidase-like deaminating enzyme